MKQIPLYSDKEIQGVYESGQILARVLKTLKGVIRPGLALSDLDKLAYELTLKEGASPAFLGYKPAGATMPYPASICVSINEVIVHGVPSGYKLEKRDVLKIDFGVINKDFFSDAAITVGVGDVHPDAKRLIAATEKALFNAISFVKPGNRLGDIGWIIKETALENKCVVIRGLTGHGIGRNLHEEPLVPNEGVKGEGIVLRPGMILAIEPMFSLGGRDIVQRSDESWATRDGKLAAHFEHTVAVTKNGPRVLTQ